MKKSFFANLSATALLAALIVAQAPLFAFAAATTIQSVEIPGELIVKWKNREAVELIKVDPTADLTTIIAQLKTNPAIEYVEQNSPLKIAAFPDDPGSAQQTYLNLINARQAWSKELLVRQQEKISRKAVIAILDTGVYTEHPDLKEHIWVNADEIAGNGRDDDANGFIDDRNGFDFIDEDATLGPDITGAYNPDAVNHGTIVAGIAAAVANNNQGVAGLSWFSSIMPLRVLDSEGGGDVFNVVRAIDYAVANGADVINMSFVGFTESTSLRDAITRAYNQGVVVVAAAGNTAPADNGTNLDITPSYPICFSDPGGRNLVIGVGSVTNQGKKSSFANYGGCVDIVAPGEQIYSTVFHNPDKTEFINYYNGYWAGTSLSTPMVSATVAIIKALRPQLSIDAIQQVLFDNSQDVAANNPTFIGKLGAGILDVGGAVEGAVTAKATADTTTLIHRYVVAGLGKGFLPQVGIFDSNGADYKSFSAYSSRFSGSINIATGDIDGDGDDEVITGAGPGGGPHVRVFDSNGKAIVEFFAFNSRLRLGVNVAAGDVDGDGDNEIIATLPAGEKPMVRIFDNKGKLQKEFAAYDTKFLGGVTVTAGDVDGDGDDEVITGAGPGGGPHVRAFDKDGKVINEFFAFNKFSTIGINVAAGDVNGDGADEIVVAPIKNTLPTVRVFTGWGAKLSEFYAFEPTKEQGVTVGVGDLNGDAIAEIVVGKEVGSDATMRILTLTGQPITTFNPRPAAYRGGARPAVFVE